MENNSIQNNYVKYDLKEVNILFNKNLKLNKHNRKEISLITKNLEEISLLKHFGWELRKINKGYKLKAPEVCLVDLTDPYKFDFFSNKNLLLDYYNFLKKLIDAGDINKLIKKFMKKIEYKIIDGDSIEFEIRIVGSTDEIYLLKDFLFNYFLENSKKTYNIEKKICSYYRKESEFKKFLIKSYNNINLDVFKSQSKFLIKNLSLPKEYFDYYIFVPTSCFKYLFLLKKISEKKISLIRIHASNNFEIEDYYNLPKNLKGKKLLIIDISYSGKTLNKLSNLFSLKGAKVKKLALFPKSKKAINNSDFCIILNKCFKSEDIKYKEFNYIYSKVKL